MRAYRYIHRLAGLVVGLVERDFQEIRRVGIRLRIESGIEAERGYRTIRLARRNLQTIASPFDGQGHTPRLVGRQIHCAAGNSLSSFNRLEFPLAVLPIPLIAALNLE